MDSPLPAERDADVLPEPDAARLLARASELDVASETGIALAELRAAAEAGISASAFDAAVDELYGAGQARYGDCVAQLPLLSRLLPRPCPDGSAPCFS